MNKIITKSRARIVAASAFFFLANTSFASEVTCLTKMAYVEANTSFPRGVNDVIDVMFNRVKSNKFPNTICKNLYKRGQYPWANKPIKVTNKALYKQIENYSKFKYSAFKSGTWKDGTKGALYFNSRKFNSKKLKFLFKREGHYFYK